MSVEPRISLLLDDASNLSRSHSNWTPHQYPQNHDSVTTNYSGNAVARLGKAKVSLAEVLNTEKQPQTPTDDSSDHAHPPVKRQRFDDASSGNFFRLPRPEVKRKDRRPRIPPLLQGLHQPPPDAGLFPPITADGKHEAVTPSVRPEVEPEARGQGLEEASNDVSDKALEPVDEGTTLKASQAKHPRKKNKWTKEETADLLKGVAKFGMGNWKVILSHDEYSFHGRSAIDLKDRFRTCCPEAYSQYKAPDKRKPGSKDKALLSDAMDPPELSKDERVHVEQSEVESSKPKSSRSHRLNTQDLAELGIEGPFTKKKRRERRVWTEEEDTALLKGLSDYGAQWAQIRADTELGLAHRQPTDLRDRVRNRWPKKYAEAGLTVKPKEILRPVHRAGKAPEPEKVETSSSPHSEQTPATPKDTSKSEPAKNASAKDTPTRVSRAQPPPPPLKLLNAPISDPLVDDFPDLGSYDEMVPASPITLDRSIFDWVNQNITQVPNTGSTIHPHSANPANAYTLPPSTTITDLSLNGFDSLHINPLVTLNKPYKHYTTNIVPPLITPPSIQSLSFGVPASSNGIGIPASASLGNGLPSMNPGNAAIAAASKGSMNANAATSIGSATLNLPPPSEVLAGFIDGDMRGEGHAGVTGPLLWDDLLN
ncbi:MAG: hypothetical protein M1822_000865 [Bathelium mastoideum]|nr:MAG: hypothetical protein M1822_000865 [Bathelium mastoideum]